MTFFPQNTTTVNWSFPPTVKKTKNQRIAELEARIILLEAKLALINVPMYPAQPAHIPLWRYAGSPTFTPTITTTITTGSPVQ